MKAVVVLLATLMLGEGEAVLGQEPPVESVVVWLCPEHRQHPEAAPGACAICGRPLVRRQLASLWSCPMHPWATRNGPGTCPACGMALVHTTRELEWFCPSHPDVVGSDPGVCPRDGLALSQRSRAMPHGDHNPRHGGLFFMAQDGFHHLEGALGPDGLFRLYFYDDFTQPLPADGFRARVAERELQPAVDGASLTLAVAEARADRVELAVHVKFPGSEREERFDFTWSGREKSERATFGGSLPEPSVSPTDAAALMEAIRARGRRVDELVRRGAWPDLFIPALEAKDFALALLEHDGESVAVPVKTLVRAAWLLDHYGDLGKKEQVGAAHRLFVQGMADLERAHAR
jgi:Heavy metal binding domain